MLRFFVAFAFLFIFSNQKIAACGYSFLGDCSTSISLKINGTQDSFAVAPCAGVLKFDGFVLGNLQSLSIARAKAATWEICQNNVSGVALYYRVYEQGLPGGTWQSLDLQEDYNTLAWPYTTRYRSANTNISLTNGLTVGKTYVLEIYFLAEVDTIGDDFFPETTLLQNNNSQNYHLTFQYGGISAPPFVVATTKVVNVKCHGDSTGVAGVSVYGNQSGLFYQWSTGGNNFPILSKLPVGVYSVTVTGAGGHTASDTIEIAQPTAPLNAQIATSGLGCSGTPGQAVATPSGGTTPYYYLWENSEQDSVATFPSSGEYALTLTDANGCSIVSPVNISAQSIVQLNLAAEICDGENYTAGGAEFSETGFFEINLPGANGACDTLIQLALQVFSKPAVEMEIEVAEPFACSMFDPAHLIIRAVTDAEAPSFEWVFNGQVISTADTCQFVLLGSTGAVLKLTVTDVHGCSAQTENMNVSAPQPIPLLVEPIVTNPVGNLENGSVSLNISGGEPIYSVIWDNDSATIALTNIGPGTYCATVTDAHGCTATVCANLETSGVAILFAENLLKIAPNPVVPSQWVEVTLPENFAGQETWAEIFDLQGRVLAKQKIQRDQAPARLFLSNKVPPGIVFIRITAENGQNATGRLSVN